MGDTTRRHTDRQGCLSQFSQQLNFGQRLCLLNLALLSHVQIYYIYSALIVCQAHTKHGDTEIKVAYLSQAVPRPGRVACSH